MRLIFASSNLNKFKEVKEILGERFKDFLFCMKDLGVLSSPDETGFTYEANADIKVNACMKALSDNKILKDDDIIFSDDTGLSIDYLNGAPGIKSARFMGKETKQEDKNSEILRLLKDIPDDKRTAYFMCVISAIIRGDIYHFEGKVNGYIVKKIVKNAGFGYDPIFAIGDTTDIAKNAVKTYASIGDIGKNSISHRNIALSKFVMFLENNHYI